MDYLIKASALIGIFYLVYMIWLQKETFFTGNRWYLLSGLVISTLLPLIVIPIYINEPPQTLDLSRFTTVANTAEPSSFSWVTVASIIYALGVIFFSIRFIIECLSLKSFLKPQHKTLENGFNISETHQDVPPFSFFKTIVYNPNQFTAQELIHIINHEKVHARDYHSIDILLSKVATIVFWCNPFVWLYKKALIQNLEFIADHKSIQQSNATKVYQNVLLKTSVSSHHMALTTNFYNSLIKKRILMLNKSNSNSIYALKYILILPALVFFMMSFNTKTIYLTSTENAILANTNSMKIEGVITKTSNDEDINMLINIFEKQDVELKIKNIKRDASNQIVSITINAKHDDSKVQYQANTNVPISPIQIQFNIETKALAIGKTEYDSDIVFTSSKNASKVNSGFIVKTSDGSSITLKKLSEDTTDKNVMFISEDGKTTHIKTDNNGEQDVKTFEINEVMFTDDDGVTTDVTDLAKDSITPSKKGDNYKIEISETVFIDDDGTTTQTTKPFQGDKTVTTVTEPLFILNGKEISKAEMNAINPESIGSVNVLKGEKAIEKYGDKGNNGVVEIILKKDSDNIKTITQSKSTVTEKPTNFLIFIDGEDKTGTPINDINPDTIESMNVLKGDAATKKYGDKAKDGVIEITLKK